MRAMIRIGHRGAAGLAPENTVQGIETVIRLGVDCVEVDLRLTADGQVVLLHDDTVDRTTNGQGAVETFSLAYLRRFDAGGGVRIPTLEEALQVAAGRVGLILECKVSGMVPQVARTIQRTPFTGQIVLASFEAGDLQQALLAIPRLPRLLLVDEPDATVIQQARTVQASHVGFRWDTVTPRIIETCHGEGLVIFVYTVNEPADIQRLSRLGVDGIISDYPDRL
jgi:glycerophosphoryl diester phosphodiesterase